MLGLLALVVVSHLPCQTAKAEAPPPRYGIKADLAAYPQTAPKETLASVLKAIQAKRVDYVLAHLADPAWVDQRVKIFGGQFEEVVREARAKLASPAAMKELHRYLNEAEWEELEDHGWARLKETPDRVFFRKIGGRWFLENRKNAS
jgi:hypothetical protein